MSVLKYVLSQGSVALSLKWSFGPRWVFQTLKNPLEASLFLSLKSMTDDKFVMLPRSNLQPVGSGNRLLCLEVGCKFLQMPFLACKKLSRMGPMHLEIAAYSCARLHRQESQISGSTQMMFSTMFFEFCLLASGPLGKILKLPKSSSRQMEPQTL